MSLVIRHVVVCWSPLTHDGRAGVGASLAPPRSGMRRSRSADLRDAALRQRRRSRGLVGCARITWRRKRARSLGRLRARVWSGSASAGFKSSPSAVEPA
eukprot:7063362-Prymnesium_polylepis.1